MAVDERSEPRLRLPGRVVAATGRDRSAHRRACRAARDGGASHRLSLRTAGEYVDVAPGAVPETATAVQFAPDATTAGEGSPTRRVDGDGPRRVVVTDPAGVVAAVANVGLDSEGPLSVCVDSLRPLVERGGDDLFWVLRAVDSVLLGRDWDCHVHHPVGPEASLPPALDHLADERVSVTGGATVTETAQGERASD